MKLSLGKRHALFNFTLALSLVSAVSADAPSVYVSTSYPSASKTMETEVSILRSSSTRAMLGMNTPGFLASTRRSVCHSAYRPFVVVYTPMRFLHGESMNVVSWRLDTKIPHFGSFDCDSGSRRAGTWLERNGSVDIDSAHPDGSARGIRLWFPCHGAA